MTAAPRSLPPLRKEKTNNQFSVKCIAFFPQKEKNHVRRNLKGFQRPSQSPLQVCLFPSAARTAGTSPGSAMVLPDSVGVWISMATS